MAFECQGTLQTVQCLSSFALTQGIMSKWKDLEVNTNFLFYKNKCQLAFANFNTCLEKCGFEMYEVFVFYTRGGKSCGYRNEGSLFPGGRAVMDIWTLNTLSLRRM